MNSQSELIVDLLPCPFCGGKAHFQKKQGNNPAPFGWDVLHHCTNGYIRFGGNHPGTLTQQEAAKVWNTRYENENIVTVDEL